MQQEAPSRDASHGEDSATHEARSYPQRKRRGTQIGTEIDDTIMEARRWTRHARISLSDIGYATYLSPDDTSKCNYTKEEFAEAVKQRKLIEVPEVVKLVRSEEVPKFSSSEVRYSLASVFAVLNLNLNRTRWQFTELRAAFAERQSDEAYLRRHRRLELEEKRIRMKENEAIKQQRTQAKRRLTELATMDYDLFNTLSGEYFSPGVPMDRPSDARAAKKEGERRRKVMLECGDAYLARCDFLLADDPEHHRLVKPRVKYHTVEFANIGLFLTTNGDYGLWESQGPPAERAVRQPASGDTDVEMETRGGYQVQEGENEPATKEATRWTVIDSYRQWKRTCDSDAIDSDPADEATQNEFHSKAAHYEVHTLNAQSKRKAADVHGPPNKKRKVQRRPVLSSTWESPPGPLWDSHDHSCAFDAWTFVLHTLWSTDKPRWSRPMDEYGPFFRDLIYDFEQMPIEDPELELSSVRNTLRQRLRATYPSHYPCGSTGVDLLSLSRHLLNTPAERGPVPVSCSGCYAREFVVADHISRICRYSEVRDCVSVQEFIDANEQPVSACQGCGQSEYRLHEYGEVLTFQVAECPDILLNSRVDIRDWGTYRLAGVIYYDAIMSHFTRRAIRLDNKVYSHDGMNGGYSEYEGLLEHSLQVSRLNELRGAKASLAIYALANIRPRGGGQKQHGS
ncbi:hypothetical protein NMY22_g10146 [Coprinellus aureogranulatus]|nr:hypothetical protein NMY22_g10146 [Coprinellus aureogranulatus]